MRPRLTANATKLSTCPASTAMAAPVAPYAGTSGNASARVDREPHNIDGEHSACAAKGDQREGPHGYCIAHGQRRSQDL